MSDCLISIIVPVFKVEEYLDVCVESIINQTYQNLEIILVDDGSPDRCPQMCDEWARRDSRIRVIHKKNGGQSSARNAGLNIARGEYIGFVDSDDYISSRMYGTLLTALLETDKKIASCASRFVRRDYEEEDDVCFPKVNVLDLEQSINAVFLGEIGTSVWRNLYHKSVFENIRFPEGEVNEEYPLIIPTFALSGGITVVSDVLYSYRIREGSTTTTVAFSEGRAGLVRKNLSRIEAQIGEYGINCTKSFQFFSAQQSYYCVIGMEKNFASISASVKQEYKAYKKTMWKYWAAFLFSERISLKDKVLYVLILMNLLRPILLLKKN